MASISRVIYVGVTDDLERRVGEHKRGEIEGFTKQYRLKKLVYFEEFGYVRDAIAREKQLKGWRREKKVALIEVENLHWRDLSWEWFDSRRFALDQE
ncbi:MAG: GIY-YIG nuclease family protein [Planctomycetes bacterium]|nr:GIY-YIG nuclease family protein [Planctomycetota bacterium]